MRSCGRHTNIKRGAAISRKVSLGDYSDIGLRAMLMGRIEIGNYVMMGPDVKIYTRNHETGTSETPMVFQGAQEERPVVIDDDVWIAANVVILPGVHIGRGAILGAGCVVRRDVPEYAVMMGNPAQVVKYRK